MPKILILVTIAVCVIMTAAFWYIMEKIDSKQRLTEHPKERKSFDRIIDNTIERAGIESLLIHQCEYDEYFFNPIDLTNIAPTPNFVDGIRFIKSKPGYVLSTIFYLTGTDDRLELHKKDGNWVKASLFKTRELRKLIESMHKNINTSNT